MSSEILQVDVDKSIISTASAGGRLREWDRQPDEPPLWFQRFGSFMTLPPSKRSLRKAYLAYMDRTEPDRAKTKTFRVPDVWGERAERHNWLGRAIAYDMATHDRYLTGVEDRKREVERECQEALLSVLRKTMAVVDEAETEEMTLHGAVYAVPRIIKVISDFFGFHQQDQALSLETIMAALPAQLRSQVLTNIRVDQLNITVQGDKGEDMDMMAMPDDVEGEFVKKGKR